MHKTDRNFLIAIALTIAAPAAFIFASAHGTHNCKRSVELQFSGRYGIYESCIDRFGMESSHKFTGRYADRFVDPVTGEVF